MSSANRERFFILLRIPPLPCAENKDISCEIHCANKTSSVSMYIVHTLSLSLSLGCVSRERIAEWRGTACEGKNCSNFWIINFTQQAESPIEREEIVPGYGASFMGMRESLIMG